MENPSKLNFHSKNRIDKKLKGRYIKIQILPPVRLRFDAVENKEAAKINDSIGKVFDG